MVSFPIEVTTPGQLTFNIKDTTGLQIWVADQNPDLGKSTTVKLPKGKHEVLIAIDSTKRTAPLHIELGQKSGKGQAIAQILN